MELLKVQIKNWQTFSDVSLECKDFLVFIGASSTGKSSFMKALLYFFQVRNLHDGDIRNPNLPLEIIGTLKEEKGHIFQLRILNNPYQKTRYFVKNNVSKHEKNFRNWEEIEEKDYKNYVSEIHIFYVPAFMKISYLDYLVEKLFQNENLRKYYKHYKKFKDSIDKKMSFGYYRHIFINFLQEIAEKEKSHNFWGNSILLWEEPEFYLTPQQERACYEALSQNTKLGLMAIVSTNSSRFIELGNYQSLCIFRRIKEEVILVEGQTDKIVLSYLAKNLGIYNYNYSIIECGSKSSIPQFIRLLNAFHIPYVAVYDKDNHYWRNEIELENSTLKNKIIQKLVWKKLGEWVEFENDIEEEIYDESRDKKNYKNKPFYALETVINPKYIVPKRLEEKVRKIFE